MRNAVTSGILVCGLVFLGSVRSAAAHEGLHEQIAAVTCEIAASPENAQLFLERAELHRIHRAWEAAEADLARAEALEPRVAGLPLAQARLQLDVGRLDSARSLVERHLTRFPDDADALVLRAAFAQRRGAVEEAVRDYDRALAALDPPEPDHYLARAEALASLGPAGLERALAGLDAGRERLGPVASLELFAIELERERGRFDDALARLDALAARSPRQERWLAQRGEILLEAGRPAEALAACLAARVELEALAPRHRSTAAARELAGTLECRSIELTARVAAERNVESSRCRTPRGRTQ